MSLGQWNLVQNRRAEQVADLITQATSELERWMETAALVWDKHTNNSETFLVSWWKANALEWPLLAVAARHLLPCCGSEVDVERLFSASGCCDEYGIRRHALKEGTVRVLLTLLRSQY
jgi:hAT family C-terminal dimerisation region